MPTIAAGSSASLTLAPADYITVTTTGGAEGTFSATPNGNIFAGTGLAQTQLLSQFGPPAISKTFGPYPMGASVTIACSRGSIDYTQTAQGLTPAQVAVITASVVDASGNVLASGGALGPYADLAALIAAKPAASNSGKTAMVGAAAPYLLYFCDGASWNADVAGSSIDSQSGNYNLHGKIFPKWHRAKGGAIGASRHGFLAMVGDSTTSGVGANAGTNERGFSTPAYLAKILTTLGIPSDNDSFFGDGNLTTDTRITLGTGWANQQFSSLGGGSFGSTTTTGTFSFAPTLAWDTVDVYFLRHSGGALASVQIAAGTVNNINTVGSQGIIKATYTSGSAAAVQALNVKYVSGGQVFFVGAVCYDSATPRLHVLNCGTGAQNSLGFTSSRGALSCAEVLKAIAADLYYYEVGINDLAASVTAADFTTNVSDTVQNVFKLSGEAIIGTMTPNGNMHPPGSTKDILGRAYFAAQKGIAKTQGCGFIDMNGHCSDYATLSALGEMADSLHPTKLLYSERAMYLANILAKL